MKKPAAENGSADDGRISLRVSPQLKRRAVALAEKQERSLAWLVKKSIERTIANAESGKPFPDPAHQPAGELELVA